MSEALIRAQIKVVMETVSGVGIVHSRRRYGNSLADLLRLLTHGGKVNGAMIYRESTSSRKATAGIGGKYERIHKYVIIWMYQIDDAGASEDVFQALLDASFDAFKANGTLNSTAQYHDQIQIESVTVTDLKEYGQDIYHTAELTLVVHEQTS